VRDEDLGPARPLQLMVERLGLGPPSRDRRLAGGFEGREQALVLEENRGYRSSFLETWSSAASSPSEATSLDS
jgi:hypothetical protein